MPGHFIRTRLSSLYRLTKGSYPLFFSFFSFFFFFFFFSLFSFFLGGGGWGGGIYDKQIGVCVWLGVEEGAEAHVPIVSTA